MSETKIVGKQQIEKLLQDVRDHRTVIKNILKMMVEGQKLTDKYQMAINYSIIAYVISSAIPKEYYDRIIIKMKEPDKNDEEKLGYVRREGNKFVVTYNTHDFSFEDNLFLLLQCIECIGHELRHVGQQIDAENEELNIVTLMCSLEMLLSGYMCNYYNDNYDTLYMEVEAVLYGNIYKKMCKISEKSQLF